MSESKSPADNWLSRIKTIIEIIAIPVAAYWAFTRFVQGEAPSLEQRHSTETYINWFESTTSDTCLAQFGMTVKNIGKTTFEVEKVVARVWLTIPPNPQEAVGYLSPSVLNQKPPQFEKVIPDQLVQKYPPDVSAHDDFVFVIKKKPGQFALLQIEATIKPNDQEPNGSTLTDYRWDYVCGEVKSTPAQRKPR